jgi:hypothetical protein
MSELRVEAVPGVEHPAVRVSDLHAALLGVPGAETRPHRAAAAGVLFERGREDDAEPRAELSVASMMADEHQFCRWVRLGCTSQVLM